MKGRQNCELRRMGSSKHGDMMIVAAMPSRPASRMRPAAKTVDYRVIVDGNPSRRTDSDDLWQRRRQMRIPCVTYFVQRHISAKRNGCQRTRKRRRNGREHPCITDSRDFLQSLCLLPQNGVPPPALVPLRDARHDFRRETSTPAILRVHERRGVCVLIATLHHHDDGGGFEAMLTFITSRPTNHAHRSLLSVSPSFLAKMNITVTAFDVPLNE